MPKEATLKELKLKIPNFVKTISERAEELLVALDEERIELLKKNTANQRHVESLDDSMEDEPIAEKLFKRKEITPSKKNGANNLLF